MNGVASSDAAGVAVVDLEGVCEQYGRYSLPYPLGRTRPVGSVWLLDRAQIPLAERLGDTYADAQRWAQAYRDADVCVECRVTYASEDVPDIRLHALRAGDLGFLATQRLDENLVDVVDISRVSPYDLGASVVAASGLTRAGSRSRIVVPSWTVAAAERDDTVADDGDPILTVLDSRGSDDLPIATVADAEVRATATVQSRLDSTSRWGVDPGRKVVAWAQVRDDGDYAYDPDCGCAVPMTVDSLRRRIDRLIAEDVAVLRQRRGPGREQLTGY